MKAKQPHLFGHVMDTIIKAHGIRSTQSKNSCITSVTII